MDKKPEQRRKRPVVEPDETSDPEPVAGPSHSLTNNVNASPAGFTSGDSLKLKQKVVKKYELKRSSRKKALRVDTRPTTDEDAPTPTNNKNKSSKRHNNASVSPKSCSSNKLTDQDIKTTLNCHDSASEEEEEEDFVDLEDEQNDNMLAKCLLEEESKPIETNYSVLKRFKNFEKGSWLFIDKFGDQVQTTRLSQGDIQVKLEVVELNEDRSDQVALAEVEIKQDIEANNVKETIDNRNRGVSLKVDVRDKDVNEIDVCREIWPNFLLEQVEDAGEYVFDWKEDFDLFTAQKEIYIREPRPTIPSTCPYELFTAVWDDNIMDVIVSETNKYAWQTIGPVSESKVGISPRSRLLAWKETNKNEMYVFFSIMIYMTLCYRARLDEYWTTGTLEMSRFRSLMSRDRFLILLRFIHFVDNNTLTHSQTSYEKKVSKVTSILDHCNKKFQELYVPKQHLRLDESLFLWNGRLSWVQCIRTKAARFGIKSIELCEGDTGYLLKTIFYTGKNTSGMETVICGFKNQTAKIVLKLSEGYLDVGHILMMDNWYNQSSLIRYLKTRHTDVVGALHRSQEGVPDTIRSLSESNMPRGEIVARHCGDISVVAWKDIKLVTMVSTYHTNEIYKGQRSGQTIIEPAVVREYNQYMGGVDLKDQRLSMYPMERKKATKWYMKVFRRLVNTSLLNTFIIYQANHNAQGLDRQMTHRQFRYAVADLLIRHHKREPLGPTEQQHLNAVPHRLDRGLHTLVQTEKFQQVSQDGYTRKHRRRCVRCSAQGRQRFVTTQCSRCNVGLCIGRCFEDYHKLEDLSWPD